MNYFRGKSYFGILEYFNRLLTNNFYMCPTNYFIIIVNKSNNTDKLKFQLCLLERDQQHLIQLLKFCSLTELILHVFIQN